MFLLLPFITATKVDILPSIQYKYKCDFEYVELIEEFPSEMSSIERKYILHLHNQLRNNIAMGKISFVPYIRNMGYVQYDLELEYIITCLVRTNAILIAEVRAELQRKFVARVYDFDNNIVLMVHYLRSYYRPFEMRKTLIKAAFEAWRDPKRDFGSAAVSTKAFNHIGYHSVRAIGCAKLITARLFPMYGYEFGCLYKCLQDVPLPEDMMYVKLGEYGKPKLVMSQKYPALIYDGYIVKPFVPPIPGIIADASDGIHFNHKLQLLIVLIMILV